jgi:hypothetical protein
VKADQISISFPWFQQLFFLENSAWNWSATRWERHATPDMISNIYTIDLVIGLNSLLF